jgi:hypothetical protein
MAQAQKWSVFNAVCLRMPSSGKTLPALAAAYMRMAESEIMIY